MNLKTNKQLAFLMLSLLLLLIGCQKDDYDDGIDINQNYQKTNSSRLITGVEAAKNENLNGRRFT